MKPARETILATNILSNFGMRILNMSLALIAIRMLVDSVGKEDYGIFVLATTLIGYFSLLGLGLPGALLKFIPDRKARDDYQGLNEIISSSYIFYVGVGFTVAIILGSLSLGAIGIFRLRPESIDTARRVLLMVGIWAIVSWPMQIYGHILMGLQRFYLFNLASAFQAILCNGAYIVIALLKFPIETAVLALALSQAVMFFWMRSMVRKQLPQVKIALTSFKFPILRLLMGFSLWVMIMQMSGLIIYQSHQILISLLISVGMVAIYNVQAMPLMGIREINAITLSASTPAVADAHAVEDKGFIRELLFSGSRINMILVNGIIAVVIAMAYPLLYVWMGEDFAVHSYICQILLLSYAISTMFSLMGNILFGMGYIKLLGSLSLLTALLNLILSLVLIKPFGLLGVALGTLISQIIMTPISASLCFKRIGAKFGNFFMNVPFRIYIMAFILGVVVWLISGILGDKPLLIPTFLMASVSVILVIFLLFLSACPSHDRHRLVKIFRDSLDGLRIR